MNKFKLNGAMNALSASPDATQVIVAGRDGFYFIFSLISNKTQSCDNDIGYIQLCYYILVKRYEEIGKRRNE